ncbi:hypothetical protein K443DRAFT_129836 [Laccaria amethystina LaAM-08-1]|uniref:Methyltransferase type 11 domain-containing protein n=1 Tax=Laccaria amethystina LaAM-08-1 TaxID=1095629 RepID=A0A0C9Y8M9_9AGAR|nr:hypothetical protein K443DRAFT_129836 [Laccaria amethystina LaAM-08-1]
MAPRTLEIATIDEDAEIYEDKTVHAVYDAIASHFSSTRYKPWPVIAAFLSALPTGWIGLDSGTGNGKYLPLPLDRPGDIWTIGLDRSRNLLAIARTAGGGELIREVVWGNVLDDGWRTGVFDYAISVATIHHLATQQRRMIAVQVRENEFCATLRLLQAVSPDHGRILIYVWAIEQDELSKRKVLGEQEVLVTTGKDVMVPWVLTIPATPGTGLSPGESENRPVYNRYYHMFAKGELAGLVVDAAAGLGLQVSVKPDKTEQPLRGVEILQDGWERSNYYVELRRWTIL